MVQSTRVSAVLRRPLLAVPVILTALTGVAVIGIDYQDQQADAAAALVEQTGADYPMYADPTGELSGRAPFPSLRGLPYTALVDDRGRLVHGEFVVIEDVQQLERMVRRHLDGGGLG